MAIKSEIKKTETLKLDFSTPQLVTSSGSFGELIIMTTGEHGDRNFSGMVIVGSSNYSVGIFSRGWSKSDFELFTGELTLKNE